jgi:hypothetical protein
MQKPISKITRAKRTGGMTQVVRVPAPVQQKKIGKKKRKDVVNV